MASAFDGERFIVNINFIIADPLRSDDPSAFELRQNPAIVDRQFALFQIELFNHATLG